MKFVPLLLVAFSLSWRCPLPGHAQARGGVHLLDAYGVEVSIGQRKSVMEGSRASLRVLARLARRYPKRSLYKANWTVRILDEVVPFVSQYDKSHRSVSRDAYAANPAISEKFRYGMDEATESDLKVVARCGESFFELGERVLARSAPQRTPQQDEFQWKPSPPRTSSHWYQSFARLGF